MRISPYLIVCFLYSSISLVFCRSRIYLSYPFYRFLNALASCWACPCIKNILLCSVSFISLANFSFSDFLIYSFFSSFFLYSIIDLALASASLCFSASASSFFFLRYSSFCLASSFLAAMMLSFFWLMVLLNSYFFLLLDSLRLSSSSFRSLFTSDSFCCSWSRVISSNSPIDTCSIYCLGLALIFFSNYRISAISSFLFSIYIRYSSFFFSWTLLRYYFSSSWIFLFCWRSFYCSALMFSWIYCISPTNFFLDSRSSFSSFSL